MPLRRRAEHPRWASTSPAASALMRCAASCSLACIRWTCTTSLSRRTAGGAGPSSLSSSRVTRLLSHRMLQHGWLHVLACGLLPGCMPPVCLWHVVRGTAGSVGLSSSSTDRLRLRRQLLSARQCPHVVTESHQWYLSTNFRRPLLPRAHATAARTARLFPVHRASPNAKSNSPSAAAAHRGI